MDAEECAPLGAQQSDDGDDDEREHFRQVCRSYQQYATFHQTRQRGVDHRVRRALGSSEPSPDDGGAAREGPTIASIVPPSLLPGTPEHREHERQFCDATIRNQFFLDNILKYSGVMTSQEVLREQRESDAAAAVTEWATEDQMSKVDSVLKSVARDWSAEGRDERGAAYDRLVGALERHLPLSCIEDSGKRVPPRVAVPGSGLGRLAWEVYSRGYSVQGSDFSLPMLLASDFMLNGCAIVPNATEGGTSFRQFGISPWLAETKNTVSFVDRTRTVAVPDVDPTSLQRNGREDGAATPEFTMMAGEFLSLYAHFLPGDPRARNDDPRRHPQTSADRFHAVVCSFFLDTAPSLPHYLLALYHMLEEGGLLLHFGPLMYHWSGHGGLLPGDIDAATHRRRCGHLDERHLTSVDYTWEEFRGMVLRCGFEILEEEMGVPARYTSDARSMMRVVYDCSFLVARKKAVGRRGIRDLA